MGGETHLWISWDRVGLGSLSRAPLALVRGWNSELTQPVLLGLKVRSPLSSAGFEERTSLAKLKSGSSENTGGGWVTIRSGAPGGQLVTPRTVVQSLESLRLALQAPFVLWVRWARSASPTMS